MATHYMEHSLLSFDPFALCLLHLATAVIKGCNEGNISTGEMDLPFHFICANVVLKSSLGV